MPEEPQPQRSDKGVVSAACYNGNHDKCPDIRACECLCHEQPPATDDKQDNRALVALDLWIERNPQWAQRVPREVWDDLVFALEATHNAALAAEREKQRQDDWDELAKLENQLLAAQSAIAEHNKTTDYLDCEPIDVDLSALERFKKDMERMDWLDKCTDKPDGFWTEFNSCRDIRELIDTTIQIMEHERSIADARTDRA